MSKKPKDITWKTKFNESEVTSTGMPWSEVGNFALPYAEWLDGRHGAAQDMLPSLDQVAVPTVLFALPVLHEDRPRGSKAMADVHGAKQRLANCRPGAWLLSPDTGWQWAKWPNGEVGWLPADLVLPESLHVRARNDAPKAGIAALDPLRAEKQAEPNANFESVADIVRRKIADNPRFKEVKDSKGYVFFGEQPHRQSKGLAINTLGQTLRPSEPPLDSLSPVEEDWLASAIKCLVQIDGYRKGETTNKSGHCIFEVGSAYIQFQAPNFASYLICEAVSGKLVPDIAAILTPDKMDRLVLEFGFIAPGRSPNFAQRIEINSKTDLAYAARLAYRVFQDIYDVREFGLAKFKVWPPEAVPLSGPEAGKPATRNFILTIDKQPLTLKLEAILALFGKARTMEFAEGKWTPFVSFELVVPPIGMPIAQHVDFTNMSEAEIIVALKSVPKDVVDFAGFVRDEIEEIEKAQPAKK